MLLDHPPASASVDGALANDLESDGYVMNFTRLWCWRPDAADAFGDARATLLDDSELTAQSTGIRRSISNCVTWER